MPRVHRSTRRLTAIAAVIALAATAAALVSAAGPAAARSTAAHKCLVMTGSGDPAFVKNFNPYTATGLPSGSFVQGSMYEPLVITGEGGLKPVAWLARSWKWTNHNKIAHAQDREGRQVVRREAADCERRRLQPQGGQARSAHGSRRPHRRRQRDQVDQGKRQEVHGHDHAQGRRLAVHRSDAEPSVRRAAAHLVEGRGRRDVHELEAGQFRPVQPDHALHDPGLRLLEEHEVLAEEGCERTEGGVPRVRPGGIE